jgi:hypothetical protein
MHIDRPKPVLRGNGNGNHTRVPERVCLKVAPGRYATKQRYNLGGGVYVAVGKRIGSATQIDVNRAPRGHCRKHCKTLCAADCFASYRVRFGKCTCNGRTSLCPDNRAGKTTLSPASAPVNTTQTNPKCPDALKRAND